MASPRPVAPVQFVEPPPLDTTDDPPATEDTAGDSPEKGKHRSRARSRAIRARMEQTGETFTAAARAHDAERAQLTNRGTP